jgi:hypothetical protein
MVCAYAINVAPPYTNPLIGCKAFTVRNPFGHYDSITTRPGLMVVNGWAVNPNNPGERVEIRVYDVGPSGTREYTGFRADGDRQDVASAVPGYDARHGFNAVISAYEPGLHSVCAWAITTGGGSGNVGLGCQTIMIQNTFGYFDDISSSAGSIAVTGWAANPNYPAEQVQLYIYDTSSSGTRLHTNNYAGTNRPDVGAAFPRYGADHGFVARFPAVDTGRHDVCVWAIGTVGGTGNPLLGCRTITVTG